MNPPDAPRPRPGAEGEQVGQTAAQDTTDPRQVELDDAAVMRLIHRIAPGDRNRRLFLFDIADGLRRRGATHAEILEVLADHDDTVPVEPLPDAVLDVVMAAPADRWERLSYVAAGLLAAGVDEGEVLRLVTVHAAHADDDLVGVA